MDETVCGLLIAVFSLVGLTVGLLAGFILGIASERKRIREGGRV